MKTKTLIRSVGRLSIYGAGFAATSFVAYVGYRWIQFGNVPKTATSKGQDVFLDHFIPAYDIVERHNIRIAAPAAIVFASAFEMNPRSSRAIRAIFETREWVMGSRPESHSEAGGLISQMRAIGWGVLAEIPDHEIVMGAVTQPWVARPVFHPLPPDRFAAFQEPGYVKIVWTLRADPIGPSDCIFRTETRAIATDATARSRFRRYWAIISAGVVLIRRMLLAPLKAEAERRWSARESGDPSRSPTRVQRMENAGK
jgi:hypothetical protein